MKNTLSLFLILVGLVVFTGCTKWTAGKKDDSEMKNASAIWGIPKVRPVVFGFTGIDRECTEKDPCPSEAKR